MRSKLWFVMTLLMIVGSTLTSCKARPFVNVCAAQPLILEDVLKSQQILFTGSAEDIARLVEGLKAQGIELQPAKGRPQEQPPIIPEGLTHYAPEVFQGAVVEMQVYVVTNVTVPEAVLASYQLAAELHRPVFANPNYLLTAAVAGSPWGVVGSPWGVVGSPWGVVGSPWGVVGSPWGVVGSPGHHDSAVAQDLFWQQWTFGDREGVAPDGSVSQENAEKRNGGEAVTLAIFDSSPFVKRRLEVVDWIKPMLKVNTHTVLPANQLYLSPAVQNAAQLAQGRGDLVMDVRDHGLFVAGLGYAVAPASDVHLYRILDHCTQGELSTLIDALGLLTQQQLQRKGDFQRPLDHTVINLSLGLTDAEKLLPIEVQKEIKEILKNDFGYTPVAPEGASTVIALEVLLTTMRNAGAVIVAAAGNDSANVKPPLPPQIPAAYSNVIGVAASTQDGDNACFANAGDVGAPGGDGGLSRDGAVSCAPRVQTCDSNKADCPYGVISLATLSPTGYLYWGGSSFATPLVSGMAARWLGDPGLPVCPAELYDAPAGSPPLGVGIATVANGCRP